MSANQWSEKLCGKVPLFDGLTSEQCQQVLALAEETSFKAGDLIVEQGRELPQLWILIEGEVEVFRQVDPKDPKNLLTLATLTPHANFGEMSFFHPAPHSANVRAKSAVKLLRIDRPPFDELMRRESVAAYKIAANTVQTLAERMRRMDLWVTELMVQNKPRQVNEWNQLREQLFDKWTL